MFQNYELDNTRIEESISVNSCYNEVYTELKKKNSTGSNVTDLMLHGH